MNPSFVGLVNAFPENVIETTDEVITTKSASPNAIVLTLSADGRCHLPSLTLG